MFYMMRNEVENDGFGYKFIQNLPLSPIYVLPSNLRFYVKKIVRGKCFLRLKPRVGF